MRCTWLHAIMLVSAAEAGCMRSASEARWAWHAVSPGETLSAIAARYRVPVAALAEANALVDPDQLRAGELLYVPLDEPRAAAARTAAVRPSPPAPARSARAAGSGGSDGSGASDASAAALDWPARAP